MRILGNVLMVLGGILVLAAVLSVVGPALSRGGVQIFGAVTSLRGTFTAGLVLLAAGAWLRRRPVR